MSFNGAYGPGDSGFLQASMFETEPNDVHDQDGCNDQGSAPSTWPVQGYQTQQKASRATAATHTGATTTATTPPRGWRKD